MGFKFNPVTGQLDLVGGTRSSWQPPVSTGGTIGGVFTFQDDLNVTVSEANTKITFSSNAGWGSSGIRSVETFINDGYVEFRAGTVGTDLIGGLQSISSGYDYLDGEAYAYLGGSFQIYEGSSFIGAFGPISAGDLVRIARVGSNFVYSVNSTIVHTSVGAISPSVPLHFTSVNSVTDGDFLYEISSSFGSSGVPGLPLIGNADGDVRVTLDTNEAWQWNAGTSEWLFLNLVKPTAFGSVPNANGLSISSDNDITLQPADATNPGAISTSSQTLPGSKTFSSQIQADGGIDVTATGGTDTLSIGANNADIINIGGASAVVNFNGTVNNNNVTNLNVTDKLVTLNDGGGAGSGSGSGIEVEENASATGYVKVSGDRNSWTLKAPNTAGDATIVPGASGITLDQSSHNPVTLGTVGSSPNANGASLSTQVLNLEPADATNPGVITAGVQNIGGNKTFSGTISASNLSGTNSGDVTITDTNSVNLSLTGQNITADVRRSDTTIAEDVSGIKVGSDSITNTHINSAAAIAYSKLALSNSIVNADVNSAAAIAYSKLALSLSIVNADISASAAIAYSKLALTSSIVNADVSASAAIAYSKLALTSSIVNADIAAAAAIAVDKLAALTASRAVSSDASGFLTVSTTTSTELDYVAGVTSAIQTQLNNKLQKLSGDINPGTFAAVESAAGASVTGLAFANGTTRAFEALVSISIDATTDLFESVKLHGVQIGANWQMTTTSVGEDSLITFDINSSGQVTYISPTYPGFVSATIKFRALTLAL